MSYYIVFEYTSKAGGIAGNRYYTDFTDEQEFKRNFSPFTDGSCTVVAQGVTQEEVTKLCLLTSEASILTYAIHNLCNPDGTIDNIVAGFMIHDAFKHIKEDREERKNLGLEPNDSFPFVEISTEDTEKNRLFRHVRDTLINPNGTIKIGLVAAEFSLSFEALTLVRIRETIKTLTT